MANIGELTVRIGADIREFERTMSNAQRSMRVAGENMKSIGATIGTAFTAAGIAVGAGLGMAVNKSMEFESQMSRVGAIADASAEQLDALKKSALELGASTSKSASEVAQGQEALAALGFTVNDILGAMPGVISAAEASGADMAQTAEVMASTLNIFGMEASKATKVADILAKTANVSAADITDMQYALKYAGPPAAALGVSLEELSASIGIMTNAGMGGEQAGTSLRAALLGLLNPSEKNSKLMEKMGISVTDAKGNFVGLAPLVENMSKSMEGMTDTQKAANLASLVGTEAVSGMLSLMAAGPAEINKMSDSLRNSGGASAEAASKMKDNLKGAVDELSGAFETMQITIGTALTPALTAIAGIVQKVADAFNKLSPGAQRFIAIGLVVATALALVAGAAGFLTMGLGALAAAEMAVIAPIAGIVAAVAGVIVAIIALGAAVIMAYNKIDWFKNGVDTAWAAIKSAFHTALNFIMTTVNTVMSAVSKFFNEQLGGIRKAWAENGADIMKVVSSAFAVISGIFKVQMAYIGEVIKVTWAAIVGVTKGVWSTLKGVISGAVQMITGIIRTFGAIIRGDWGAAWEGIKTITKGAMKILESIVKGAYTIGKNLIDGLIEGVTGAAKRLYKKVADIAASVTKKFKSIWDINSPSRVMEWQGEMLGAGVEKGMLGSLRGIIGATKEMASAAVPSLGREHALSTPAPVASKSVIQPAPVLIDGYELTQIIFHHIQSKQSSEMGTHSIFGGFKK
jgi:TP901 family phage tail tape measure protein